MFFDSRRPHHYTVQEIDALRDAVRARLHRKMFPASSAPSHVDDNGYSWSFSFPQPAHFTAADVDARVEEEVRTHMMAGHTAADLK